MRPGFQSIKGLLHCISAALHFSCIAFQSITGLLHCISAALHYSQSRVSCIAKAWQVPVWHGAEPMKQSVNCHRSPKRQLQRKAETALHCSIMHNSRSTSPALLKSMLAAASLLLACWFAQRWLITMSANTLIPAVSRAGMALV